MGKTFNTINIKPDISSFIADTLTNSGSLVNLGGDPISPSPPFFAGKDSGKYNTLAKKGAFYADLTNILESNDLFGGDDGQDQTSLFASPALAFTPYLIFNQPLNEINDDLKIFSEFNPADNTPLNSGFDFANNYASLLPFNVKVEGLVFDNRAKAVGEAAYTFATQQYLPSTPDSISENQIPFPSTINTGPCEITLTALINEGISIPAPPPLGSTPFSYNFTPGNIIQVRVANDTTNPNLPPNAPTNNGFNAIVNAYNQFTREITFTTDGGALGNWGGLNRWVVTNQTNNNQTYVVNVALDNIIHFEMQFACYPIQYYQTGVYPDPADYPYLAFTTSGNPTQFSTSDGEYISQVTYRKFWSPSTQDINNPNGISLYGNLFNHILSVDSFAGSKINPFNLNLENNQEVLSGNGQTNVGSATFNLNGGFQRKGHIVIRGTYNMY